MSRNQYLICIIYIDAHFRVYGTIDEEDYDELYNCRRCVSHQSFHNTLYLESTVPVFNDTWTMYVDYINRIYGPTTRGV